MPLVTIHASSKEKANALKNILPQLRKFIAKELTCDDRTIKPEEVSIKIFVPFIQLSIADIEVSIMAYSYSQRVKRQDEICLAIRKFISSQNPLLNSVFVWLQLSELGHSLKE